MQYITGEYLARGQEGAVHNRWIPGQRTGGGGTCTS
jgi:hypothetical protein